MKSDGKKSMEENPRQLQERKIVTQGCYNEKSPNREKNNKDEKKNDEKKNDEKKNQGKMEKFTKNEPIPFDELSTSRGNTNNVESKRNLQNLLGSYYSSDEESDGESQERENLTQEDAAEENANHHGISQRDSDTEDEDESDTHNDSDSDDLPDEGDETSKGKDQTEQSTGNERKTPKGKEEEPSSQPKSDEEKKSTSCPSANKCQKKRHNEGENKSSGIANKINYNEKRSKHSWDWGYNVHPKWGIDPMQTNYHEPPGENRSFFQNVNSDGGRQYPYDVTSQHVYKCSAPTHPKGNLNNLSLTNFGFSTKKEINVDLQNIPVIDQRQILNDWKPTLPEEKKKKQQYNIKTKVYNPVSNTFDKVIMQGNKQKRKHQINWLAKEAVEKEYEILQKTNYSKRRTTNDKYGW
ncbi:conserved Plasmodium protein, unknown function [Plasmodium knowlesi strain H]|uniref:Uncharacterized protein n=3 Tax=Plasmodium knowlesi TaxID=5850 RepID=A0A5K1VBN9_PLAKH|nr:conserved protein, unknown function [Plasmodium knowlesi strain H]OTN66136.1 Uncharacterized protein PKNOH_S09549800 [Plasmodium knowlesi]CAA9989816.1 conserved protein, unknown function [Plasmodium knowlesi strain H]SBO24361.1 conserved Plasmodium protein, unknown function [Plasmodium knowlesi strain H]SBO26673.1 conserved Plasmodium protein, unknown function [Plasmodium knowlesi strain H]VVS79290.1 conserved protein, unknown function [Plasmodium knowlesi strain H]|eukprot:XP_002259831.1 hypothetical protein, conserved in Plasmodium species [Plasmodium knowlesi strain H]